MVGMVKVVAVLTKVVVGDKEYRGNKRVTFHKQVTADEKIV